MSSNNDLFVFDSLEPKEQKVSLVGEAHILREATEAAAVNYLNVHARAAKFSADGKPAGLDNVAEADPTLLSQCLYKAGPDGRIVTTPDGRPDPKTLVRLATILSWPSRVVVPMVAWVKEVSELERKDTVESIDEQIAQLQKKRQKLTENGDGLEERAKNAPGATTSTSDSAES